MGDGTAFGVQTPKQPGVIVKEGENFPRIPEHLLELSPDELQKGIDRIVRAQEFNQDRLIPNLELQEKLELSQFVHECAKTAVERQ